MVIVPMLFSQSFDLPKKVSRSLERESNYLVMRLLQNFIVTFYVDGHFTPMRCFDSFLMLFKSHFIRKLFVNVEAKGIFRILGYTKHDATRLQPHYYL
ncbi:hypothetical protein VR7878_03092 [Vibrio ruber DSM 16370]|uniref:Uncharacterized protein n=1 Tax=Vibrio ruber (strain DSM 16370 / JCM 11486 / BCRC 17186 / CECT 7878 / LMG 23124 / VR1) TaxID=1123498 RepID=A0A1R4LQJ1_VIBR1|nr:hypothetical protein VR7878_03092 [Vibrio ruber DSM 16370]